MVFACRPDKDISQRSPLRTASKARASSGPKPCPSIPQTPRRPPLPRAGFLRSAIFLMLMSYFYSPSPVPRPVPDFQDTFVFLTKRCLWPPGLTAVWKAELWFSLADRRRQVRRGTGGRPSRAAKGKIRPPPTEALSSSSFLCK